MCRWIHNNINKAKHRSFWAYDVYSDGHRRAQNESARDTTSTYRLLMSVRETFSHFLRCDKIAAPRAVTADICNIPARSLRVDGNKCHSTSKLRSLTCVLLVAGKDSLGCGISAANQARMAVRRRSAIITNWMSLDFGFRALGGDVRDVSASRPPRFASVLMPFRVRCDVRARSVLHVSFYFY